MKHVPVLLDPIMSIMRNMNAIRPIIIDATFGEGHYTRRLLEMKESQVIAFDRDPLAYERAVQLSQLFPTLFPIHKRFGEMDNALKNHPITALQYPLCADAVIFDLGMSTNQIVDEERGFSFARDSPLDMRMDSIGNCETLEGKDRSITAHAIVNHFPVDQLSNIFKIYGDEKQSLNIAKAIDRYRQRNPIQTTRELAKIIVKAKHRHEDNVIEARKSFQALRVYINNEYDELVQGLMAAENILKPGGLLCVVTFHSTEDRIVKNFLKWCARKRSDMFEDAAEYGDNASFSDIEPSFVLSKDQVKPCAAEIKNNPSSRSAQLRWAQRTHAPSTSKYITNPKIFWQKSPQKTFRN